MFVIGNFHSGRRCDRGSDMIMNLIIPNITAIINQSGSGSVRELC